MNLFAVRQLHLALLLGKIARSAFGKDCTPYNIDKAAQR